MQTYFFLSLRLVITSFWTLCLRGNHISVIYLLISYYFSSKIFYLLLSKIICFGFIWRYGGTITNQIRRLGASCDWTREHFTLDEQLSRKTDWYLILIPFYLITMFTYLMTLNMYSSYLVFLIISNKILVILMFFCGAFLNYCRSCYRGIYQASWERDYLSRYNFLLLYSPLFMFNFNSVS